jgi:hypothetical protein
MGHHADVRLDNMDDRRTASAATPRGMFRMVAATFAALCTWLVAGRRYQPERRYMRGGRSRAEGASARR